MDLNRKQNEKAKELDKACKNEVALPSGSHKWYIVRHKAIEYFDCEGKHVDAHHHLNLIWLKF